MRVKLQALNGPLGKSEFRFPVPLTIGRDGASTISVEDDAVAPRHCQIHAINGGFQLTDLGSASGTFVNGIPIRERTLSPGDHIGVGGTLFLFQLEDGAPGNREVHIDDASGLDEPSRQPRHDELLYLQPESLAALPPSARLDRTVSTLLKISTAIGSIRDVESLQWQLLGMIFDVIPAERGAILLVDTARTSEILSTVGWDRVAGPEHPVHVSRTMVERVIREGIAVLETERPAESAKEWVLCAPLAVGNRVLGIVYLDSRNPGAPFTKEDLQLLAAIAGLAAIAIENARQFERLGDENQRLRAQVNLQHDMVGQSARMRQVCQFIEKVAPSDSTVLIQGESGTGKELAARAIHKNSPRKDQPFVALNCAALTETLLESELFGHEKGAFTSAIAQKKGLLEVAENGSVFLDEVGELSLTMQAKLLRVLQEREFVRVGGTKALKLSARFLAATNRDLQKAVRDKAFRPDLFHRLNVISFTLPPLRERREDIPMLAEYFASRYAKRCNRDVKGVSAEARAYLERYEWPGNIRELENAMERAVVIGSSAFILPEDLPETLLEGAPAASGVPGKFHDAVRDLKKQLIIAAFEQAGGNVTEAARLLALNPNYLHRLIRNLELRLALRKEGKS
jgi:transcriptional regulator with GAF, ATPase, and Fis domain